MTKQEKFNEILAVDLQVKESIRVLSNLIYELDETMKEQLEGLHATLRQLQDKVLDESN